DFEVYAPQSAAALQAHDVAAVAVDVHQRRVEVAEPQRTSAHDRQNGSLPERFASSSRTVSIAVYVGTTVRQSPGSVSAIALSRARPMSGSTSMRFSSHSAYFRRSAISAARLPLVTTRSSFPAATSKSASHTQEMSRP